MFTSRRSWSLFLETEAAAAYDGDDVIRFLKNHISWSLDNETQRLKRELVQPLEKEILRGGGGGTSIRSIRKSLKKRTRKMERKLIRMVKKESRRTREAIELMAISPSPPPPRHGKVCSIILLAADYTSTVPLDEMMNFYRIDLTTPTPQAATSLPPFLEPFYTFPMSIGSTLVSYYSKIFCVGGRWEQFYSKPIDSTNYNDVYSTHIYSMDLTESSTCPRWIQLPQEMIIPRWSPRVLVFRSKLFVFGGICNTNFDPRHWVEVFDPLAATWESLPIQIPTALYSMLCEPAYNSFNVAAFSSHEIFISIKGCLEAYLLDTNTYSLKSTGVGSKSSSPPFFGDQVQIRNMLYNLDLPQGHPFETLKAYDMSTGQFFYRSTEAKIPKEPIFTEAEFPEPIFTEAEFPKEHRVGDSFILPQLHCDPFSVVLNADDPTDELYVLFKSTKDHSHHTELLCRRLDVVRGPDDQLFAKTVSTSTQGRISYGTYFLDAFCLLED